MFGRGVCQRVEMDFRNQQQMNRCGGADVFESTTSRRLRKRFAPECLLAAILQKIQLSINGSEVVLENERSEFR